MNTGLIVVIAVALLVASAILPTSLTNYFAADTTTWDPGTAAVYGLLPLLALLAIIGYKLNGSGTRGAA